MNLERAKNDIVEYLYTKSAYEYSNMCENLGLKPGSVDEAFRGKKGFVRTRINSMDESKIRALLSRIKECYGEDLIPEHKYSYQLSNITRRDVVNLIRNGFEVSEYGFETMSHISWHGCMDEYEFLKRVFDVNSIRLMDSRCHNFEEEYYRHRVFNNDYDDDYFWTDERFFPSLIKDDDFLNCICEMVNPEVRDENSWWEAFVNEVNNLIIHDGYELFVSGHISGRDCYSFRKVKYFEDYEILSTKQIEEELSSDYINHQIDLIKQSIDDSSYISIGKSKELLESCLKFIASSRKITLASEDSLQKMDKAIRLSLGLDGKNVCSRGLAKMTSCIATMVHGLAEMRNEYGDGHGKDISSFIQLDPIYARFVVNSVINYCQFLLEINGLSRELV